MLEKMEVGACLVGVGVGLLGFALFVLATRGAEARDERVATLIVLGSGGHTTEMLRLIGGLDGARYGPVTLVVAATDDRSRTKAEGLLPRGLDVRWEVIPRAREVGQSFSSSVATTLRAARAAVGILVRARPALVLANGPGTCVPVAVLGVLSGARLIFCESWCRVESLSLSGRLLYPVAHRFVVHWPQLAARYPRAEYVGRLC